MINQVHQKITDHIINQYILIKIYYSPIHYISHLCNHKLFNYFFLTNIIAKSDVYECKRRIDILESLVEIKDKPCLLHKDYHFSHIIADNNKIGGIIDFEWAIAGHNELDLFKSEQWMFDKLPELKHYFFKGYKKFGNISKEYEQRKKLYEIILLISSIVFSYEMKHKNWLDYNMKKIKNILSRC